MGHISNRHAILNQFLVVFKGNFAIFPNIFIIYIYIYILYIYIEQYRHVLSTNFCICPFQLPNWFYDNLHELVDTTPITNCYPSSFYPILGHHHWCVNCKSNGNFACTLLLCRCLSFILVYYCNFLFVSISTLGVYISENNSIYTGFTSTTLRLTIHKSDTISIEQHRKKHSCSQIECQKILTKNPTILE